MRLCYKSMIVWLKSRVWLCYNIELAQSHALIRVSPAITIDPGKSLGVWNVISTGKAVKCHGVHFKSLVMKTHWGTPSRGRFPGPGWSHEWHCEHAYRYHKQITGVPLWVGILTKAWGFQVFQVGLVAKIQVGVGIQQDDQRLDR